MSGLPASPALCGNEVVVAGRSYTIQCHQPDTGGLNGSYMVIAKLRVPAGAPLHCSNGDSLAPWQPNALAMWRSAMGLPGGRSGLVSLKVPSAGRRLADQQAGKG